MQPEHPFAQYVRILGKGQKGSRGLTQEEACTAMGMLLDGVIEDTQLGAFLMLLRFKEETAEELAGFAQAVQTRIQAPAIAVDLDWPSYAGKKRQLPWYLLAVKALSRSGVRILMHGGGQHTDARLYTEDLLQLLEIPECRNWQQVSQALDAHQLAFIGLQHWMPALQRAIDLRGILGLRSPVHSLARLLNPLKAHCVLQSIFHPNYQRIHQQANVLLEQHALIIKGDGGEIEIRPDVTSVVMGVTDGQPWQETWPEQIEHQIKVPTLEPERLLAIWQDEEQNRYAEQAIIATIALGMRGLGNTQEAAFRQARQIWQQRHASHQGSSESR